MLSPDFAALHAANAGNTLSVGLEFERHVRDGSSGAITLKHLFNENQAAALKVKVGPDTRGGFAQLIQGMGESIDPNGFVTATVGYQQFDRSGDFSGTHEEDALDTYVAAMRYTHVAKDTAYWEQGFVDVNYVNIQSASYDYAAANGGWPDVRKWEAGVGGTMSFLNRGIAATPRVGMKWTQTRHTDGDVNDRDALVLLRHKPFMNVSAP